MHFRGERQSSSPVTLKRLAILSFEFANSPLGEYQRGISEIPSNAQSRTRLHKTK